MDLFNWKSLTVAKKLLVHSVETALEKYKKNRKSPEPVPYRNKRR